MQRLSVELQAHNAQQRTCFDCARCKVDEFRNRYRTDVGFVTVLKILQTSVVFVGEPVNVAHFLAHHSPELFCNVDRCSVNGGLGRPAHWIRLHLSVL